MEVFRISNKISKRRKIFINGLGKKIGTFRMHKYCRIIQEKKYKKHFVSKLTDSDAECSETLVWVNFAYHCGYLQIKKQKYFTSNLKMLEECWEP